VASNTEPFKVTSNYRVKGVPHQMTDDDDDDDDDDDADEGLQLL